jgi:hypothetical protein
MRAKNMQALTNDVRARHYGVVVYGVGDDKHKTRISDHNEDDTSGSKAAQSDADNVPEHRAIDIMLGKSFTKTQANKLVADLLASSKARLFYIIFNGSIWSRSNNWVKKPYDGDDQHTDHVHVSGLAADDENAASWLTGTTTPTPAPTTDWMDTLVKDRLPLLKLGSTGWQVGLWQQILQHHNFAIRVDDDFGKATKAATLALQKKYGAEGLDGEVGPETWTIGLTRKDQV